MAEMAETEGAKKKPAAKSAGSKGGKPPRPTLEEALEWNGMSIDGLGNKTLGRIAGIHVDAKDGEPRWALIRIGPLAGCTAGPFEHVAEGAGRRWAAYDEDGIRSGLASRPKSFLPPRR